MTKENYSSPPNSVVSGIQSTQNMSRQQAYAVVQDCLQKGMVGQAKYILFQILGQLPFDGTSRAHLRKILLVQSKFNSAQAVNNLSQLLSTRKDLFFQPAMSGWSFIRAIDWNFVQTDLPAVSKPNVSSALDAKPVPKAQLKSTRCSDFLHHLNGMKNIRQAWMELDRVLGEPSPWLYQDSYAGVEDEHLPQKLREDQSASDFNITIIGAGPVGLFLANILKRSLKEKVEILVVDNRVVHAHQKSPYNRKWLLQISQALVNDLVDDSAANLFEKFGQPGHVGARLNIFEGLLLAANKEAGVKFLFQEDYNLAYLSDSKTAVVFDATGGRLRLQDNVKIEASPRITKMNLRLPQITEKNLGAVREFGVNGFKPAESEVELLSEGPLFRPKWQQMDFYSAMLKITGLPLSLKQGLLDLARDQKDNLFFVWSGKQKQEINEILLLVNLDRINYEAFSGKLTQPIPLSRFFQELPSDSLNIDSRIKSVFQLLNDSKVDLSRSAIEPPFVFSPYINLIPSRPDRIANKPLIPIGDSTFNGHPKLGNGLSAHLRNAIFMHDALLAHL